jgi:hypothetical protein
MHRIVTTLLKLATAGSLALSVLGTAGCYDDLDGDPAYYPSDGTVALDDPVYYDGQATYFFGGRWYYRNGGRWNYYHSEPGYLRSYRGAHPALGRRGVRGRGGFHGGGHGGRR